TTRQTEGPSRTSGKHDCFCPCGHLRCALYRLRAHLPFGAPLVLVGHFPACGDGSAADYWDRNPGPWCGGRSAVHLHPRIYGRGTPAPLSLRSATAKAPGERTSKVGAFICFL